MGYEILMSVLACARNGCDNIMCGRYSSIYGYICDDCFDQLVEFGPRVDVREFMASFKTPENVASKTEATARYNVTFPLTEKAQARRRFFDCPRESND